MTIQRVADACTEYKEKVLTKTNQKGILRTGLDPIDERMPIVKGDYILLTGRENIGKTSLALQFCYNVAREGKSVVIFLLRTTKEEMVSRLLSLATGEKININNVFPGEKSFIEALDRIADMDIYFIEGTNTIEKISKEMDKWSERYDLLFFDHFNYLLPDGHSDEDYAEALPDMYDLEGSKMMIEGKGSIERKKEITGGSTVLVTIPFSRNSRYLSNDSKPSFDDQMMVYGCDFQTAFDKVMLLHRDDYYGLGIRGHAELHVIERWRYDCIIDLAYDNKTLSFSEMTDDKMRELRTEHDKEYQVHHFIVYDNDKDEEEEEEKTPIIHWDFLRENEGEED